MFIPLLSTINANQTHDLAIGHIECPEVKEKADEGILHLMISKTIITSADVQTILTCIVMSILSNKRRLVTEKDLI